MTDPDTSVNDNTPVIDYDHTRTLEQLMALTSYETLNPTEIAMLVQWRENIAATNAALATKNDMITTAEQKRLAAETEYYNELTAEIRARRARGVQLIHTDGTTQEELQHGAE